MTASSPRRWVPFALATALFLSLTVGLASAARVGGNPQAYNFLAKAHGVPVHWDKCKVIRYRVSSHRLPPRGVSMVREAVRRAHAASGLRFQYLGKTAKKPYISARYPGRTRLIVGYLNPKESKPLTPRGPAGVGGAQWMSSGEIIKGYVQINKRFSARMTDGFGKGPSTGLQGTEGQLIMHELAHALGLQHVGDRRQIMYPSMTRKLAVWGRGDRNGLERVGKMRRCF